MPYPTNNATNKHDLVCPRMIPPVESGTLLDSEWGFTNTARLFEAVEQGAPKDLKKISSVYSYPDSPSPPLSRALYIIGFADTSLSVVRKLIGNHDNVASCLHRCTVAVKRADGNYGSQLDPNHTENSSRFAKFFRRLHQEGIVAVMGNDKQQRFGIFAPMPDMDSSSSDYSEDDYCANCYIGVTSEVKEYLTSQMANAASSAPTPMEEEPTNPPEETGLWKPPGSDDNNNMDTDDGGSSGFWQPPNADSGGGFGDDNGGDFGGGWDEPSSSSHNQGRKRSHSEAEEPTNGDNDDQFHADSGAAAADAFYSGLTRSLDTRSESRIFHMRAFNGWVKATQIQELDPRTQTGPRKGLRVLDLACGKGGDLGKWAHHRRGIANYVGVDVARGSLRDAAIRARKMRKKLPRCTFTCADLGADVPGRLRSAQHTKMQKLSSWSLLCESEYESDEPNFQMVRGGGIAAEDKFDVISIQFAIHYMMQTRQRARRFFQTCSELLEVGGNLVATTIDARVVLDKMMDLGLDLHFEEEEANDDDAGALVAVGEGKCRIQFTREMVKKVFKAHQVQDPFDSEDLFGLEYTFTLQEGSDHAAGVGDAVNLPEWLNPIPVLSSLAEEAGLKLEAAENFHEFFGNRKNPSAHPAAHEAMYNMKVLNRNGSISADEWEISRMYVAIKFQKVRESRMTLEDDGVADDADDEEPEPPKKKPALDPVKSKKMLPMAMMKAKKAAGADAWKSLDGDQKKELIQAELEKMLG